MLKIIISPAKKMNLIEEYPCEPTTPVFLDRALDLHERLKKMTLAELTTLWGCSDKLAAQNHERLHTYSPEHALSPALLSYEGIQYQHIAPGVFTDAQWNYVNSHLRILSGFYGILAPTDTVVPYRLEMQAKLKTENDVDLYGYWGNALYEELVRDGMTELVNLASGEYSKAILPYIKVAPAPSRNGSQTHDSSPSSETCPPCIPCITCIFGDLDEVCVPRASKWNSRRKYDDISLFYISRALCRLRRMKEEDLHAVLFLNKDREYAPRKIQFPACPLLRRTSHDLTSGSVLGDLFRRMPGLTYCDDRPCVQINGCHTGCM